jgi:hypothetical protein
MQLSEHALRTLDRFASFMAAGSTMLGAKIEIKGRIQTTYTGINFSDYCDLMQENWIPDLKSQRHYINVDEYANDCLVFTVNGKQYAAQNRILRQFMFANQEWVIRDFTSTSITFRAGNEHKTKQLDFTFTLNE